MRPTMGRMVRFRFTHRNADGTTEERTRPAVVISDPDPEGRVMLQPLFSFLDYPISEHSGIKGPSAVPVAPHYEPKSELGVVERCDPQPGTWFWPPNVHRAANREP